MGAARRVVIGVGNEFRQDDGVGPRVVAELSAHDAPDGVELHVTDGEPSRMLDLWTGAELAVVVDAFDGPGHRPGQWLKLSAAGAPDPPAAGTHGVGLGTAVALGEASAASPAGWSWSPSAAASSASEHA